MKLRKLGSGLVAVALGVVLSGALVVTEGVDARAASVGGCYPGTFECVTGVIGQNDVISTPGTGGGYTGQTPTRTVGGKLSLVTGLLSFFTGSHFVVPDGQWWRLSMCWDASVAQSLGMSAAAVCTGSGEVTDKGLTAGQQVQPPSSYGVGDPTAGDSTLGSTLLKPSDVNTIGVWPGDQTVYVGQVASSLKAELILKNGQTCSAGGNQCTFAVRLTRLSSGIAVPGSTYGPLRFDYLCKSGSGSISGGSISGASVYRQSQPGTTPGATTNDAGASWQQQIGCTAGSTLWVVSMRPQDDATLPPGRAGYWENGISFGVSNVWFGVGHPMRGGTAPSTFGYTRELTCKDGTGATTTVKDVTYGTYGGSAFSLGELACPAGTTVSSTQAYAQPTTAPGVAPPSTAPKTPLIPPTTIAPPPAPPSEVQPDAGCEGGTCPVKLKRDGQICDITCLVGWVDDWKLHPSRYTCSWGSTAEPIGMCSMYRNIAYGILPNVDPTTGDFLSPDAPAPGSLPNGGTITTPSDATDISSGDCFPTGWGLLNPVEWVVKPVKCGLVWAFVPRTSVLTATQTAIANAWAPTIVGRLPTVVSSAVVVPAGGSGCQGPHVQIPLHLAGANADYDGYPLSACADPAASIATWARLIGSAILIWFTGLGIIRRASSVVHAPGVGATGGGDG